MDISHKHGVLTRFQSRSSSSFGRFSAAAQARPTSPSGSLPERNSALADFGVSAGLKLH
jgi:hypothetical protein